MSQRTIREKIADVLSRRRRDGEMEEELRFHLDMQTEENVRRGMSPEVARREALRRFGGSAAHMEGMRDAWGFPLLEGAWRSVRHSLRTLRRSPTFSVTAVLMLAFGIASVTAIFTLVHGVLLRPLPYQESERLVAIRHAAPGLGLEEVGLSSGTVLHYREHARSFTSLATYRETTMELIEADNPPERVQLTAAAPELFDVLAVQPLLGRVFIQEDWAPVVAVPNLMDGTVQIPIVLSYDFWQARFGGDPGVIGRIVRLNSSPREVIGVMPQGFAFPNPETQVWVVEMMGFLPVFARSFDFEAVARLTPGVTAEAADAELTRILPSIEGRFADATAERMAEVGLAPRVAPLKQEMVGGAATALWALFGAIGCLLLVACSNVVGLFLVRSEDRGREAAVRTALGASRRSLLGLSLGESLLLAAAGTALGLLLALGMVNALLTYVPVNLPRAHEIRLDGASVAFAAAIGLAAAVVLGWLSVGSARDTALAASLRVAATGVTSSRSRNRFRRWIVAGQLALSLTLVAGSGLMLRSYRALTTVDRGFDATNVLTVDVSLPFSRMDEAILDEIRALPGVRSASAASFAPLVDAGFAYPIVDEERAFTTTEPGVPVPTKFVTAGYFETMASPVIAGEGFPLTGASLPADPVWLSASLARRLFPNESPVGRQVRRLMLDGRPFTLWGTPVPAFTVAGVVGDVREESLRNEGSEVLYVPVMEPRVERSFNFASLTLLIRTEAPPEDLAAAVRHAILEAEPAMTVARIRTMESILAASIARESFVAVVLLLAGGASLMLGAIGIYGVVAYTARRRFRELGIRAALGAGRERLIRDLLADSSRPLVVGILTGLLLTVLSTRVLRSLLFGVEPLDPMTILAATALIVTVAVGASLLPAQRAVRADPIIALRSD